MDNDQEVAGKEKCSEEVAVEFTTTIAGRRWRICLVPGLERKYGIHGECDPPSAKAKAIRIDADLSKWDKIETIVHEMLHATIPTTDEGDVRQYGADVRRVLKRVLGE